MDDKTLLLKTYLDAFLGSQCEMVRVVNGEGKVFYTNASFDRNLAGGVSTQNRPCFELFGLSGACRSCAVRDVLAGGVSRKVTRKFKDSTYSVSVSPLRDENGDIFGALEVYNDITLDFNIKQTLMERNAKMGKDLTLAKGVQQALVKNVMPNVRGYSLYSGFFPCEAVSGDMFDCLVDSGKIIMYVADVSGHGVMPAMLGVFFSRAVKAAYSHGLIKPSQILDYAQREFQSLDISDTLYITAFIAVIETGTGEFLYSNAGLSVVPALLNGDKLTELEMKALPISKWFGNPDFRDDSAALEPGGRLLLYTDGVNGIHSGGQAKDVLYNLFKKQPFDSRNFVKEVHRDLYAGPEDDLTLLICSRDNGI